MSKHHVEVVAFSMTLNLIVEGEIDHHGEWSDISQIAFNGKPLDMKKFTDAEWKQIDEWAKLIVENANEAMAIDRHERRQACKEACDDDLTA